MTNPEVNQLITNIQKVAKEGWKVIGIMQTSQYVDFMNTKTKKHRLIQFEVIDGGILLKYPNGSTREVKINE